MNAGQIFFFFSFYFALVGIVSIGGTARPQVGRGPTTEPHVNLMNRNGRLRNQCGWGNESRGCGIWQ